MSAGARHRDGLDLPTRASEVPPEALATAVPSQVPLQLGSVAEMEMVSIAGSVTVTPEVDRQPLLSVTVTV